MSKSDDRPANLNTVTAVEGLQRRLTNKAKRWTRSPFLKTNKRSFSRSSKNGPIVHCTYHKMGTKWFTSVLAAVADHYGLSFQWIDNQINQLDIESDIIVLDHSDLIAQEVEPCFGSHLIRDFRDVVVSGYFYHLWTTEQWAQIPREKYDHLGYKQYLNGLSRHDGLLAEIGRLADYAHDRKIREWNFQHPRYLELKYENVFGNEEQSFRKLFHHYGFSDDAIDTSVKIATTFSFKNLVEKQNDRQKSHLRSGKSGQWAEVFDLEHKEFFKDQLGDLLVLAGYENDNSW